MSAVLKTVWFIETRFRDNELSLETMAEHAGVSRSHLSRIFPVATGMQLSSYLRGRRLTEAAKELVNGAPDILNVALDVGYGSHEAFTRAFRDQFRADTRGGTAEAFPRHARSRGASPNAVIR